MQGEGQGSVSIVSSHSQKDFLRLFGKFFPAPMTFFFAPFTAC